MSESLRNWAGNRSFHAVRTHRPEQIDELCEIVAKSQKVKAAGTRHSFNDVADTTGDLILTDRLTDIQPVDRERKTVTMGAGVTYGALCLRLDAEGFAVRNLASLPHISVVGACATATHGSGDGNGNLSTSVAKMEVVSHDGSIHAVSRSDPDFSGAVVSLGALGIVARITLDVVPQFEVVQTVYEGLPFDAALDNLNSILSAGYSVSLFTAWQSDVLDSVWVKQIVNDSRPNDYPDSLFGAKKATADRHPLPGCDPVNCPPQRGLAGPSHERLPHFKMNFIPSSGDELQSEYLVPRRFAVPALTAIHRMKDQIVPLLQISEIRSIATDDLWLSPCCGEASIGIHFTWKKDWPQVSALLPAIEERLADFDARPHWGKLFTIPSYRFGSLYPRMTEFRELAQTLDSSGKFRNPFLERFIFGPQHEHREK